MNDFGRIIEGVINGEASTVEEQVRSILESGGDPEEIIYGGLIKGMDIVAEKWKMGEYFVPEVLIASRAMKAGMSVLAPRLQREVKKIGTIVIGTVKGDIHDIGKNLVCLLLEASGFRVIDLGTNVEKEKFVEAAVANNAGLIGLSSLLTTTMPYMKEIIDCLQVSGLRNKVKILVGGAPVSQEYADKIGADGYGANAPGAVEKAKIFSRSV